MKKSVRKTLVLISLLFCSFSGFSKETEGNLTFNIVCMTVSPDKISDLSSAKWENFPVVPLAFPALGASYGTMKKNEGFKLFDYNWAVNASLTPLGIGGAVSGEFSITPLLTLSANSGFLSGWNFGSLYTGIGVYDYDEGDYRRERSLSEAALFFEGKASVMIPTKIVFLNLTYSAVYTYFTGADAGEVWTCATYKHCVNGWAYSAGASAIKFTNLDHVKMIAFNADVKGYYKTEYFDDEYKNYNPGFVTVDFGPMAIANLTPKVSMIIKATVGNMRDFKESNYDSTEELKQTYDGWKIRFKTLLVMFNIKIY